MGPHFAAVSRTEREARRAWLVLMIGCLNHHYCGDAVSVHAGPVSPVQRASILRLAVACDEMFRVHPNELASKDWGLILNSTALSYTGEEISTCQRVSPEQVIPGLPPPGLAASIDVCELVSDTTRSFLLSPESLVDRDRAATRDWPRPRLHSYTKNSGLRVLGLLYERGILGRVGDEDVLLAGNRPVLNGMFGVVKAKCEPV